VLYLQQAAETARSRSAHAVAERHYRRALEILEKLPAGDERDEREVALQIGFGQVVMQTHGWGYPAVEATYTRVRQLSEGRGPGQPLLSALWHLWIYSATRGNLHGARVFADRLFTVAGQLNEAESLLQAHHAQWSTLFALGDLVGSEVHTGKGLETYDRANGGALSFGGHDAGICARLFRGRALAFSGHADTAARLCDDALRLARELDHPFTMAFALMHAAAVHQTRRDVRLARTYAQEARDLAGEHRFDLMGAWATCFLGWAMIESADLIEGAALLEEGVVAAAATGSILFQPHMLALRATAELACGRSADARTTIREAMAIALRTGESFYLAELHRLSAEIHLAQGYDADTTHRADEELRTAMRVAAEQGAAQLLLRATVGLVRLRRHAGGDDAIALLADARRRVVEGGDLPDLREADALLSSG
jgi:predicted ATPase